MIINNSMYPLPSSYSGIKSLQDQFSNLQQQLASGQKSATLADMGSVRFSDLTVRARMSRLSAYDTNIDTVNLRLNTMNQVLTSLTTITSDTRSAVTPGVYGTNNINLTTAPTSAQQRLDQVLTGLNTDLNGHYLFGGGVTDHEPVAETDAVLNGKGGLDGFKTVAAQRLQADQGADGLGRLKFQTPASTDTVTLAEDGAHPFGFKLQSITASGSGVTLTRPTGSPGSLSVQFNAQPVAGDTVSIGLKLPDGTTDTIQLKAVSGTPQNPGEFQIGATTADTAANLKATLQTSLQSEGSAELAIASNSAAAADFFNGQGEDVRRVAIDSGSNSYYAASGYETSAQTQATTVQWYTGEDSNGAARASVSTKVDDTMNVNYGAEANESGFTQLVRSLAVQAIQTYPTTDAASTALSQQKYDAVASRQVTNLSALNDSQPGSIASMTVDLGLAQSTLKDRGDRHTAYGAQLQDVLSDAENADPNEVASALLELQTRLSASYSATAMISQLQLANYLK